MKHLLHSLKIRLIADRNYKTKREYLRKLGVTIGDKTRLNCGVNAFGSEPYLVEVGDDCLFAAGTRFITHDGGVKVLNSLDYFNGRSMRKMGRIKVGNNTYFGENVMVMPGVTIGNNCIIGAHAVVTKDIPDNSCAVGVPARVICTLDEYYEKNKDKFIHIVALSGEERKQEFLKLVD